MQSKSGEPSPANKVIRVKTTQKVRQINKLQKSVKNHHSGELSPLTS